MSTQAAAQKHKVTGQFSYTLYSGFLGLSRDLPLVLAKSGLVSINGIEV